MTTLMYVYLIGGLVTFIAVTVGAPYLDHDSGARWRHTLAAVGGLLWPVLFVGAAQLGALVAVRAVLSRRRAPLPDAAQPVAVPERSPAR